jgi:hypothetical protein
MSFKIDSHEIPGSFEPGFVTQSHNIGDSNTSPFALSNVTVPVASVPIPVLPIGDPLPLGCVVQRISIKGNNIIGGTGNFQIAFGPVGGGILLIPVIAINAATANQGIVFHVSITIDSTTTQPIVFNSVPGSDPATSGTITFKFVSFCP